MKKATCLNDIISVNADFKNAINLYLNLNDKDKILSYIPTKSSISMLNTYLESIYYNKNNASILVGPYGKGKSHLLLLVMAIASLDRNEQNEKVLEELKNRIKIADAENVKTIELIDKIWAKKKFLPVIIMSSYSDLNQAFLMALNDALKREELQDITPDTYYSVAIKRIETWQNEYPSTYQKLKLTLSEKSITLQKLMIGLRQFDKNSLSLFSEIYPELTSGSKFNPLAQLEVLPLYKSVCDKLSKEYNYSGIYILFDEFSKFIENQDEQVMGNNMKLLQDICELSSNSKESATFITMVAHKSIKEYGKYLSNDIINAFTGIEGRLVENLFITSSKNNYELIKHAIIKNTDVINPYKDIYLSDDIIDKYYKVPYFNGAFNRTDFKNIIAEGCYPLNPISSYLLMNISEKVAQNERTLFTFISKDEPHSMARYINEHTQDKPWIISADLIYDYFSGLFKKDINNENVHTQWLNAEYALSRCKSEEERSVIKALAIILIVNKPDEIPATNAYIQYAANNDNVDIIQALQERGIIYKKASTNCYMFKTRAGADLRKEIRKRNTFFENSNPSWVFKKVSDSDYIMPMAYNNDYYMTRYFRHIFMSVDNFLNIKDISVIYDDIGFCDGCLISLYSDRNIKDINLIQDKVLELESENTIVEYSEVPYKCKKQIQEYEVLNNICNDEQFIRENEVMTKEIPVLEEDLRNVILANLDLMYLDGNHLYLYFMSGKVKLEKNGIRENIVDKVCYSIYNKTPIINNEFVNRRKIPTAQTKKARKIIIENILNKTDSEDFYAGNGQEASIYRALFIVTKLKENEASTELNEIINIIKDYINQCVGNRKSIADLYKNLVKKPYSIREGLMPFYFAYVISQYNEDIVLYFNSMEIEINTEIVSEMFEHPDDFSIYVSQNDRDKEDYLNNLQKLFDVPVNKITHENRIALTAEYFKRWYRGLPQISRNMTEPSYEYLKDDTDFKKIRKLKKVIQKVESNPYEMLFDSIPNISESDNLNDTFYWIKESKKLFDGYFDWMVKNIVNVIYQLIAPNSKDDLYHILKEWYEKQSAQLKQGLFDGKVTQFVSCLRNINSYDDHEIAEKIAKVVTDVYVEAWNDKSIYDFKEKLEVILQDISQIKDNSISIGNYKLKFIGHDNTPIELYYNPVGEEKGTIFRNIVEDTIDQFEDDLSVNDRVAILLEMIEKMIK